MYSGISGQLRMEGKANLMPVLYGNDMIIHGAKYFNRLLDRRDIRGADKYHWKGGNLREVCCGAKTAKLSAVGITFDRDRQSRQMGRFSVVDFFGKQDQTGTGSKDRESLTDHFLKRFHHMKLS